MGLRTLIFLLLIGILFWLLKGWLHKRHDRTANRNDPGGKMLRCAHCGLHVPENEAIRFEQHSYCCEQHRQLGPQD